MRLVILVLSLLSINSFAQEQKELRAMTICKCYEATEAGTEFGLTDTDHFQSLEDRIIGYGDIPERCDVDIKTQEVSNDCNFGAFSMMNAAWKCEQRGSYLSSNFTVRNCNSYIIQQ
jgi:hypothetical protein